MGVTRRYWGDAGLVVALAGLTVLFERPLLLVGAAGVGGWVLARQFAFARTVSDVAATVSVVQSPERDTIGVDETVEVGLSVELPRPAPVSLEVEADPPTGMDIADGDQSSVVVPLGEETATTTFSVRCPLAGSFEFDPATVTATDETGRFRAAFPAGEASAITVEAAGPKNLHVGAGGNAQSPMFGRYDSDERGSGIDLAELREYVPGDTAQQIDWKATARLNEPHVREFETDTERRTAILLDRRASMAVGPEGQTKFDYARQVALGVISHARQRSEPIALYEVGAEGLLDHQRPTATEKGYVRLERRVRALEPQNAAEGEGEDESRTGTGTDEGIQSPAVARQRTRRLRTDDSAFADRLGPFFADADPYAQRVRADPLYGVARTHLERLRSAVTTVVLTDDENRTETQEVVKVARRNDGHVMAFLTPSVLFERDEPTDPKAAYERYADFERFRRKIAAFEGVSAFEVGPGDRLDRLLAADTARRRAGVSE